MLRFENAWILGLLALIPLVAWIRHRAGRSLTGALRYSAVDTVRASNEGRVRWTHKLPDALGLLTSALVVVALARPQTGISSESVSTQAIDIVLALDVSSSMLAEDLEPNRLEAAKAVAADFVAGRRNDRIGLVAFAGEAFTQAPLTLDYGVITELLGELKTGMIEDGTAVGMGLATAVKRLEASDAKSKVVILLTDGRNNRGEIGPVTAAQMAKALGVRVYTIGAGSRGSARVPIDDPLRGRVYATMRVDVDDATLKQVAELTGGRYFRATDRESLAQIYKEIDQLERTEVQVKNYTRHAERFGPVLAAALLLLVAESALSWTVLRRLP
jgi:Ca-activated chloride channel homolog